MQRTTRDLTPTQKERFRKYVSQYRTLSSEELANDLGLELQTVRALKAWAVRAEK